MKKTIIDYIREIVQRSEKAADKQFEDRLKWRPTKVLARRLTVSEKEALIFAYAYFETLASGEFKAATIREIISDDPFQLVTVLEILKDLNHKKLIHCSGNQVNGDYRVTSNVIMKIAENKNPTVANGAQRKDLFELTEELTTLFFMRFEKFNSTAEFYTEMDEFYAENKHYAPFKFLHKHNVPQPEWMILLHAFLAHMNGETHSNINKATKNLYNGIQRQFSIKTKLMSGEAVILKKGLIEFVGGDFKSTENIRLTQKSMKEILKEHYEVVVASMAEGELVDDLIKPSAIVQRTLFYNKEEASQLKVVADILLPKKTKHIQQNLMKAGHKTGICLLFHGVPGTGKTETALQLAKTADRAIMKVDIASIKDKFVGETEKNLKRLFTEYSALASKHKNLPILLFNEADALLNRRIKVRQSTDQMNNAMQNILLEELENFKGILIATTNLIPNLDKAFERRFLYKIEFKSPTVEVRKAIWTKHLPELSDSECQAIAEQYNLSGGQIDNVLRKIKLNTILYDTAANMDELHALCTAEVLEDTSTTQRKIGFSIRETDTD